MGMGSKIIRMSLVRFLGFFLATYVLALAEVPQDFRYRVEVLATDIPRPMELEVAPDGRVFYNDYYGRLKIFKPETNEIVEAGKLTVFEEQENGFLGFALDRDFDESQFIYLFYSPVDYVGQRLSRFKMSGDLLDLSSETMVLEFAEQRRRCCHHAGSVEFAPDGCLLISTGDNTFPGADTGGYAPIDERPEQFPIDAQKSSANTHDLRGKILRIRPLLDGSYEIPDGNLFPKDGSGGRPEIFVMGCRNPWRMSVDQETGIVYWGDVGPDAGNTTARGTRGYDEVNQARKAGNYGWPYFVGNNFPYADYDFATGEVGDLYDSLRPINESPNNTGSRILPPAQPAMIFWPYADSPEFPMLGSGGRTACAGPVFHYRPGFAETNGFPEFFDKCLLFWDWQRPFMKWARFDEEQNLRSVEDFTDAVFLANEGNVPTFEGDEAPFLIQRPVDAKFGADGCLYMLDYGKTWGPNKDSRLIKISYLRGNLPPIAKVEGKPMVGREPLKMALSGEGSRDPENDVISYSWRLHPGDRLIGSQRDINLTIDQPGNYVAALTVSDSQGLKTTSTLPVVVGNSRPAIHFISPENGDFFSAGEPLSYQVKIEDEEDGSSDDYDELMEGRTFLTAKFKASLDEVEVMPPGLAMMGSSDCFNCHSVNQKIVGPPLVEIANRYRGQTDALEASVQRVINGSTGVWGEVPMLPHSQHSEQEVDQMVRWIFGLKEEESDSGSNRGLYGKLAVPTRTDVRFALLEASYTDMGRDTVSSLIGTTSIALRNRQVEAEHCDSFTGLRKERANLGSINDGASATFRNLNLRDTTKIWVQLSSGGSGGTLEVRRGSYSGDLLAAFKVKTTGGWNQQIQLSAAIEPINERTDIVLVFSNPGKRSLMNVDWLRFDK